MAVTMAEISKLRKLTGAGMMDCKNALTETNGDIEAAKEIIRKKGQAVAAKREDREASEGCVLARPTGTRAPRRPRRRPPRTRPWARSSPRLPSAPAPAAPWRCCRRACRSRPCSLPLTIQRRFSHRICRPGRLHRFF